MLFQAVSSSEKFGFTIGVAGRVLRMISSIRQISEQIAQGHVPDDLGVQIQEMVSDYRRSWSSRC
jgi:hypothetical protein